MTIKMIVCQSLLSKPNLGLFVQHIIKH